MKKLTAAIAFLFIVAFPVSSDENKYDMTVTLEFKGLTFKKAAAIEEILREHFGESAKIDLSLSSQKEDNKTYYRFNDNKWFIVPDYSDFGVDSVYFIK